LLSSPTPIDAKDALPDIIGEWVGQEWSSALWDAYSWMHPSCDANRSAHGGSDAASHYEVDGHNHGLEVLVVALLEKPRFIPGIAHGSVNRSFIVPFMLRRGAASYLNAHVDLA
jgi:hypothetical protein